VYNNRPDHHESGDSQDDSVLHATAPITFHNRAGEILLSYLMLIVSICAPETT
jgi:hypothetical protein